MAAATHAIRAGDLDGLHRLLADHPGLAVARVGNDRESRTLLHVATDWPGHFPNGAATVAALVRAGADVNARFVGAHTETPLHWAASSDDVEVLDALLDAGAEIDANGAVIAGGTPLADATAFGQWHAARRLVERGAHAGLWEAATLGLLDRVQRGLRRRSLPPRPRTSPAASGVRATAVSRPQPNSCSTTAPTSTGSVGTASPHSMRLSATAPEISPIGSASAALDPPRSTTTMRSD